MACCAAATGAQEGACAQICAYRGAHDALTEGGPEHSKTLLVLGFPYENAHFWDARALRCPEAVRGETEVP